MFGELERRQDHEARETVPYQKLDAVAANLTVSQGAVLEFRDSRDGGSDLSRSRGV